MEKIFILIALIGIVVFLIIGCACNSYKRYILSKYKNPGRFRNYLSTYDTIYAVSRVGVILWISACIMLMFFVQ